MSTLPNSETVCATASRTRCSSLTSTALVTTLAEGKLAASSHTARSALSGWMSQSETPDAPCSRSARAATNPRFPHPPVTARERVRDGNDQSMTFVCFSLQRTCCCDSPIAFPLTAKRQVARSAELRFGGGGVRGRVRGLDAWESIIWGRTRVVSSSLDAGAGAIFQSDIDRILSEFLFS